MLVPVTARESNPEDRHLKTQDQLASRFSSHATIRHSAGADVSNARLAIRIHRPIKVDTG
jgi:hypothetical protein